MARWSFWSFVSAPVLTAPVPPQHIFSTVSIHVSSFIDLLETQFRGWASIYSQKTENEDKHNTNFYCTWTWSKHPNIRVLMWPPDGDQMASLCDSCGTTKTLQGRFWHSMYMEPFQQQSLILWPADILSLHYVICTRLLRWIRFGQLRISENQITSLKEKQQENSVAKTTV